MGHSQPDCPIAVVVEDDFLQAQLATTLLERIGFAVVEYQSAEAALTYMRTAGERVAMLFTDVNLAGCMDGVELSRFVRADYPDVEVLVTSSNLPGRTRDLPERTKFMPKPWRPSELIEVARSIHERVQEREQVGSQQTIAL